MPLALLSERHANNLFPWHVADHPPVKCLLQPRNAGLLQTDTGRGGLPGMPPAQERERAVRYARDALGQQRRTRQRRGASCGQACCGSRFKLTGLRIGSEAATKESAPRETPAALKTLQQDLLGCDNQTRAFLELIVSRFGTVNRSSDHVFYKLLLSVSL